MVVGDVDHDATRSSIGTPCTNSPLRHKGLIRALLVVYTCVGLGGDIGTLLTLVVCVACVCSEVCVCNMCVCAVCIVPAPLYTESTHKTLELAKTYQLGHTNGDGEGCVDTGVGGK